MPASKARKDFRARPPEVELDGSTSGIGAISFAKFCLEVEDGLQGLPVARQDPGQPLSLGFLAGVPPVCGKPRRQIFGQVTVEIDRIGEPALIQCPIIRCISHVLWPWLLRPG